MNNNLLKIQSFTDQDIVEMRDFFLKFKYYLGEVDEFTQLANVKKFNSDKDVMLYLTAKLTRIGFAKVIESLNLKAEGYQK